jgi:hypothetical protein
MYEDYAINAHLFHWESQSQDRESSAKIQRYIHHKETDNHISLFVREYKRIGAYTAPYIFLGDADYDKHEKPYVTEKFRFSVEGEAKDAAKKTKTFVEMLYHMQDVYIKSMNICAPLFRIKNWKYKLAPYDTIVIDIEVENVKGAFVTIVNCAGPDRHQFHASDIWVRANPNAGVWKSLFDYNDDATVETDVPFVSAQVSETEKWLEKVKDARNIVKECITTSGEPSTEEKEKLLAIMKR